MWEMKKLFGFLIVALSIISYASENIENNSIPTNTLSKEFVFIKVIEGSKSSQNRFPRKFLAQERWYNKYENLKSQIESVTGRKIPEDGYLKFDENWQLKESGFSSTKKGSYVSLSKYLTSNSDMPNFLYNSDPYYIEKFIDSFQIVGFQYNGSSTIQEIIRSKKNDDISIKSLYSFVNTEYKFGFPTKNDIGELLSWNVNFGYLDGMDFSIPFKDTSPYFFKNPKYVFNADGTISFYGNDDFLGKIESSITYTYENNKVKTMEIKIEDNVYTWMYDSQGRTVEATGPEYFNYSDSILTHNYTYDSKGVVTEHSSKNKNTNAIKEMQKTTYNYDNNNQFESFELNYFLDYGEEKGSIILKFIRDDKGNVIKIYSKDFVPFYGEIEGEYILKK